jgi:CheY-like chemotaxis protein
MNDRQLKTILIVDDDPEWREFIGDTLGTEYAIRFATNGDDALRVAQETGPGAIVLDVMMPGGKDGFTVLCELRKDPATRDIPVIMFSSINEVTHSSYDEEILATYLGYAPSVFLEKPVRPQRLLKEVAAVL